MNKKKQSSIEFYDEKSRDLIHMYVNGDIDVRELLTMRHNLFYDAEAMHNEEITDAIKAEIKLIGNYFDVDKLEQREQRHHIRFTLILKDRFDHYNKQP